MCDQVPGDVLCCGTVPISLDGVKGDTLASVGAESWVHILWQAYPL